MPMLYRVHINHWLHFINQLINQSNSAAYLKKDDYLSER